MNHRPKVISGRPFFVYGSLRPGHGNAVVWNAMGEPRADGEALAPGFMLLDGGAFPYAVRNETGMAVGCLIYPLDDWCAGWLMEHLDALEGHPRHYERQETLVTVGLDVIWSWIYVAGKYTTAALLGGERPCQRVPLDNWNMRTEQSGSGVRTRKSNV